MSTQTPSQMSILMTDVNNDHPATCKMLTHALVVCLAVQSALATSAKLTMTSTTPS